jgi:hypothetical protein
MANDARVVLCRVCEGPLTPGLAANTIVCRPCWLTVPGRLRIAAITAFRTRRTDPARHQEAQIGIFQWCHEQRAARARARTEPAGRTDAAG